jgi:hypothetical protein
VAATQTWNSAERNALKTKLAVTTPQSIDDLRTSYYGGKVSQNDAIRSFLQGALTVTTPQSVNDLWRMYFVSKGVTNQVSLGDMAKTFFLSVGF